MVKSYKDYSNNLETICAELGPELKRIVTPEAEGIIYDYWTEINDDLHCEFNDNKEYLKVRKAFVDDPCDLVRVALYFGYNIELAIGAKLENEMLGD